MLVATVAVLFEISQNVAMASYYADCFAMEVMEIVF